MGLGKRLGEFDDRTAIYRTNDPEQRVHWGSLVVTFLAASVTFSVLMAVGRATIGESAALGAFAVMILAFLVFYVVWRRRRNERLTGSPTEWPDA